MPRAPGERGWTERQRKLALIASNVAGWDDAHRYLVLRHVGCADAGAKRRPSISHPRNTQDQFEAYMAIAESAALTRGRGDDFPTCGGKHAFWRDAAADGRWRVRRKIAAIAGEAEEHLGDLKPGWLAGFCKRQTLNDDPRVCAVVACEDLDLLDEGQCYRVLEGLKVWIGRELHKRGIRPKSFQWHAPGGAR